MRPRLQQLLVCPLDGTPLELVEWETSEAILTDDEMAHARRCSIDVTQLSRYVLTGVLLNRTRMIAYPVYRGVPRMLVFKTAVAESFLEEHGPRLKREFPGFDLPNEQPMPGERDVLRTFSNEWLNYDWDADSYWDLKADEMYRCMRFMLALDENPIHDGLALEVGIGIGGIADYVARSERAELVGIDLSYAVDAAQKHFGHNPFLHIVQASAFALPFRADAFDLVYSHGVLHHTFSTREAFNRISALPKKGKGRLYVWVYSWHQESRTAIRRALMLLESVLRPVCWRLPGILQTIALLPVIPLYLIHQHVLVKGREEARIDYGKFGIREAMHAARDRFTPRFVHRHTNEEVSSWFRAAGYSNVRCVSQRQCPDFLPETFAACAGVDGARS
jgi:uncharacterized protein YbaR (Trm112 family)/2-polyprenyl-3-methyl-5-hydroxy-6-metoxy-1,4-benzoquinol methylase